MYTIKPTLQMKNLKQDKAKHFLWKYSPDSWVHQTKHIPPAPDQEDIPLRI